MLEYAVSEGKNIQQNYKKIEDENLLTLSCPYRTSLECKQKMIFCYQNTDESSFVMFAVPVHMHRLSVNHAQLWQRKMDKTLNSKGEEGRGMQAKHYSYIRSLVNCTDRYPYIFKNKNISPTRNLIIGRINSSSWLIKHCCAELRIKHLLNWNSSTSDDCGKNMSHRCL